MNFKFNQISDQIFLLTFDHPYDLAIRFLRVQETYESTHEQFRDHVGWTIIDFMEWYVKSDYSDGNSFSYADDWAGFNVRSELLHRIYREEYTSIVDHNQYDQFMYHITALCDLMCPNDNWSLIGALEGDMETIPHELSHAFWATDPEYQAKGLALIQKYPELCEELKEHLRSLMYTEEVIDDECFAYMSTNSLTKDMKDAISNLKEFKKVQRIFAKIFKEKRDLLIPNLEKL